MIKQYPSSKIGLVFIVKFEITRAFSMDSGFVADTHTWDFSMGKSEICLWPCKFSSVMFNVYCFIDSAIWTSLLTQYIIKDMNRFKVTL